MTSQLAPTTPCPDDERLGAFVEGRLSETAREDIEAHLVQCAACVDVVAAALPVAIGSTRRRERAVTCSAVPGPSSLPWRRFAWAATLMIAIGGIVLAAARGSMPGAGPMIGRAVGRWLGADVRVAAVGVRLGSAGSFVVRVDGLQYRHGDDLFSADEVETTVALASLVSSDASLRRLVIVRPRVHLAQPVWVGIAVSHEARRSALAMLGAVERVEVVDGTIGFRDGKPDGATIEGVTGGIDVGDGDVEVALRGRFGGGTLDVTGSLGGGDTPFTLTVAGRDLATGAIALLQGHVDGRAEVRVDMTDGRGDTRCEGRIAIRDGRWVGGGPTRTVALDQTARRALLATAPHLAGDDLPFDDLRAEFAWRRGAWILPRVFVRAGELVAGGEARVGADGTIAGHGTVRLPPGLVRELAPYEATVSAYLEDPGSATLPFRVGGPVSAPRFALDVP